MYALITVKVPSQTTLAVERNLKSRCLQKSLAVLHAFTLLQNVAAMLICVCRTICTAAGQNVSKDASRGEGEWKDSSGSMTFGNFVAGFQFCCKHSTKFSERNVDRQRHIKQLMQVLLGVIQDELS